MTKNEILEHLAEQTHFRPEDFKGGAVRHDGDFNRVHLMLSNNGQHLVIHRQSLADEVVIEIHDEYGADGQQLGEMVTLSCGLRPGQRYDLAMYLLKTVNVLA